MYVFSTVWFEPDMPPRAEDVVADCGDLSVYCVCFEREWNSMALTFINGLIH